MKVQNPHARRSAPSTAIRRALRTTVIAGSLCSALSAQQANPKPAASKPTSAPPATPKPNAAPANPVPPNPVPTSAPASPKPPAPKAATAPASTLAQTAALSFTAADLATKLPDPHAKFLAGINLKALRDSNIGKLTASDFTTQMQQAKAMGSLAMGDKFGATASIFDVFNRIDRITISSPGMPAAQTTAKTAATAKPANPASNAPVLIAIQGHFEPGDLKPLLTGPRRPYRGITIYTSLGSTATTKSTTPKPGVTTTVKSGDQPMNLAQLDPQTLLLGDPKSVVAALDRLAFAAPKGPSDLMARATTLATQNDIWMVASDLKSSLAPSANPTDPAAAGAAANFGPLADALESLDFGLSAQQGLAFELGLSTKDPMMANMLSQMLSGQMLTSMAAQSNNPQAAEMVKRLQVSTEGPRLSIRMTMSEAELEEQVRTAMAQRANAATAAGAPSADPAVGVATIPPGQPSSVRSVNAPPDPRPAKPEGKRVIRIYGLDDGVREIPLNGPAR
jgi:hypothetical protein